MFDTSTVAIDRDYQHRLNNEPILDQINESLQYNNDDSSIVNANTIEERDDSRKNTIDGKKSPPKIRKTIGHYSIGKLFSIFK